MYHPLLLKLIYALHLSYLLLLFMSQSSSFLRIHSKSVSFLVPCQSTVPIFATPPPLQRRGLMGYKLKLSQQKHIRRIKNIASENTKFKDSYNNKITRQSQQLSSTFSRPKCFDLTPQIEISQIESHATSQHQSNAQSPTHSPNRIQSAKLNQIQLALDQQKVVNSAANRKLFFKPRPRTSKSRQCSKKTTPDAFDGLQKIENTLEQYFKNKANKQNTLFKEKSLITFYDGSTKPVTINIQKEKPMKKSSIRQVSEIFKFNNLFR